MKKIIFSLLIIFLIFLTSLIKNSTKKLDVKIFNLKEDIRLLNSKYELVLLDHNFLSSPKKLDEYQKKYFEDDLIPTNIKNIKEGRPSPDKSTGHPRQDIGQSHVGASLDIGTLIDRQSQVHLHQHDRLARYAVCQGI